MSGQRERREAEGRLPLPSSVAADGSAFIQSLFFSQYISVSVSSSVPATKSVSQSPNLQL